jgi:hypothetical protein
MAKASIFDLMMVINIAVATLSLAEHNPEAVLPILEAFGEAGEVLHRLEDFSERQDLLSVHREILQRIDQVEQAGLRLGVKTKVQRAAGRARRRAKFSGQDA